MKWSKLKLFDFISAVDQTLTHNWINDPLCIGDNALMWATKRGHAEIVKYLLVHGASVNDKNDNGKLFTVTIYCYKSSKVFFCKGSS